MKRTIKFKFRQTGFNAHSGVGEFTYETEEGALAHYKELVKTSGFFDVELV